MFLARLRRIAIALLLAGVLFVPLADFLVAHGTSNRLYSDVQSIPYRPVGLVLGCVRGVPGGGENPFFRARINAAVQLFSAHKIDYILVSGDNNKDSYNEPLDMRDALVEAKIPRERIYLDYAGFRTLDSVVRAREVFGANRVTIVSQEFHNARAVYLAQNHGMDAVAFNARAVALQYSFSTLIRERFAQAGSVFDVMVGRRPRFLGPVVRIGVDAPAEPTSGARR